MSKKIYRRLLSLVLSFILLFTISSTAYATNVDKPSTPPYTVENNVYFGNGYVQEQMTTQVQTRSINIQRTSYKDGRSITYVTENGITKEIHGTVDYALLLSYLTSQNIVSEYGRASGYEYIYMKTDESTEYFTPKNGEYSTILGAVSLALSKISPPLSVISGIASIILAASSSPNETKVTTTSTWYFKHEKATGEFICYYVECSADTYVKDLDGNWVYLGTETWDYEALSV